MKKFEKCTKLWKMDKKIDKILKNQQNFDKSSKFWRIDKIFKTKNQKYFWQHIFTIIFQKYSSKIVFYTLEHFHILETIKVKKIFFWATNILLLNKNIKVMTQQLCQLKLVLQWGSNKNSIIMEDHENEFDELRQNDCCSSSREKN